MLLAFLHVLQTNKLKNGSLQQGADEHRAFFGSYIQQQITESFFRFSSVTRPILYQF